MTDILVKRLQVDKAALFYLKNRSYLKLSDCKVDFEIWEKQTPVKVLGNRSGVKRYYATLAITIDNEPEREITLDFLYSIDRLELQADIERQDGKFERLLFDDLHFTEFIDLDDPNAKWQLEIRSPYALLYKLKNM